MDRDHRRSGAPAKPPAPRAQPAPAARASGAGGAAYAGLGFQFGAALVAFYYLGQWLDRRLGTAPVFLLLCVLAGSGAAFFAMYRQLMRAQRRDQAARAAGRAATARDATAREAATRDARAK